MTGARVLHIVQFADAVDPAPVQAMLVDLHAARAAGRVAFVTARLGRTVERAVTDGLLGGPIQIATPAARLVLTVEFETGAALDAYYAAPAHAEIRRTVFSALSPRARALYAAADDDPSDAPHLYGAIETALRPLLTRMDIEIAHGD